MDPYETECLRMNDMGILPPIGPGERASLLKGKTQVDERTAELLRGR
jgi:hypothetical protein